MKTITTLLSAALFASAAITAQADNSLSNLIYEDSSNIYTEVSHQNSTPEAILSYGDDAKKDSVWSTEFEQYVNPDDFKSEIAGIGDVNQYLGNNPAAAGTNRHEVFIYNELAGEYQLQ